MAVLIGDFDIERPVGLSPVLDVDSVNLGIVGFPRDCIAVRHVRTRHGPDERNTSRVAVVVIKAVAQRKVGTLYVDGSGPCKAG